MTGRYKAYTEYKDSDVDWLHDIPTHWKTIPVGRCYRRVKRTGFEKEELLSVYRDHGVVPKSSRDDNNNKPSDDLSPYQLVCENNLVMNKMKAWQGSIAISEFRGIVSPAYFVYEPMSHIDSLVYPKYVHYLLRHPIYITQYMSRSKGIRVNQWDLDPEEFQRIELLLPQIEEQKAIISFLDHETAKIDTLIDKQEKLIELLKEKRQAVISHAVTKGLNPDAPMKDSGVEWLGEVPEHWAVVKCGYLGRLFGSEAISDDLISDNGDVPFVKVSTLSLDSFDLAEKSFFVDCSKVPMSKAKSNYVVFPKRGAAIFTNKVNIVKDKSFINPNLMGWELDGNVLPEYVAFMLKLRGLSDIADVSTVPQINNKHIEPMKFPLPPITEQKEILESLSGQVTNLNLLVQKASEAIELMKERKTALISAAVTGKIDVRDWEVGDKWNG